MPRFGDERKHALHIQQNIAVPEMKNEKTLRAKERIPLFIAAQTVLLAIDFDDERRVMTEKIGNIRSNRRLPPKPPIMQLPHPQMRPEFHLGPRHVFAKRSCASNRSAKSSPFLRGKI
jgi:hypothetical protein